MLDRHTSSRNSHISHPGGAAVNDGGGASAVEARTPATFASKYRRNSIAPMSCDDEMRPRPSNASTERHSWVGDDRSASTFADQKASHDSTVAVSTCD